MQVIGSSTKFDIAYISTVVTNNFYLKTSKIRRKTSWMEFGLVKLQAYHAYWNYTIHRLYHRFKTNLKKIILEKCLWCTRILLELCKLNFPEEALKLRRIYKKTWLVKAFQFSCRSRVYPCNFNENRIHHKGFP